MFAILLVCLVTLVASTLGAPQFQSLQQPPNSYGPPTSPTSPSIYRPQDNYLDKQTPAHYDFSYEIRDDYSGNNFGHSENRENDITSGRFFVLLPDGRTQIVTYTVDENGYHPSISYEGEAHYGADPSQRPFRPQAPVAPYGPGPASYANLPQQTEQKPVKLPAPRDYDNSQPTTFRPALQTYVSSRPHQA